MKIAIQGTLLTPSMCDAVRARLVKGYVDYSKMLRRDFNASLHAQRKCINELLDHLDASTAIRPVPDPKGAYDEPAVSIEGTLLPYRFRMILRMVFTSGPALTETEQALQGLLLGPFIRGLK